MEPMVHAKRTCSVCQQSFSSGLSENITATALLRTRRMLIERRVVSTEEGKKGLDTFLEELEQRQQNNTYGHMSLRVCLFCTQFLPPMYQEGKSLDEHRHQWLSNRFASRSSTGGSLVIQHHFHRKKTPRKSPHTNDSKKPVVTPRPPPSTESSSIGFGNYRLVTQGISRVLQVQATTTSSKLQEDVMKDLSQKVQQETKQILSMDKAKRVAHLKAKKEEATWKKFYEYLTPKKTEQLQVPTDTFASLCVSIDSTTNNNNNKKKTKKKKQGNTTKQPETIAENSLLPSVDE